MNNIFSIYFILFYFVSLIKLPKKLKKTSKQLYSVKVKKKIRKQKPLIFIKCLKSVVSLKIFANVF